MRHAVIIAGGSGTRLWPMSRQATPKQFQKLIGNQTLLQQTFARAARAVGKEHIWVATGEQFVEIIREQLPDLESKQIIAEPSARNTAAACALASLTLQKIDEQAEIIFLPADHYVAKPTIFAAVVKAGFNFIDNEPKYIVTIGIRPTSPKTGYGYIKRAEKISGDEDNEIFKVDSFHEKPEFKTAQKYFKNGRYFWNGGYFIVTAKTLLNLFSTSAPEILSGVISYLTKPSPDQYETIPKEPIDKAIVEKAPNLAVIPTEMGWSDIGDWAALHEVLSEHHQSSEIAVGEHIGNDTENSLVISNNKLIVTVGVKDVVIIDTDDVLLVCHKDSAQEIKKVVEALEATGDNARL